MARLKLKPKTQTILKCLGIILLLVLGLFLFFTRLLKYIAPFLIAFVIMMSIEWLVDFFQKKIKLSRSPAVAISIILFIIVLPTCFP